MLFAAPPGFPWSQVPSEIVNGEVGPYVRSEIGLIETDYDAKSFAGSP